DLGVMYSHRERSLLLTGSGRKSCRLQNAEFVPLGDPLQKLGIALPLEQPGRSFGPAQSRLDRDPDHFLFLERQRPGRPENAVLIDRFDGDDHGGLYPNQQVRQYLHYSRIADTDGEELLRAVGDLTPTRRGSAGPPLCGPPCLYTLRSHGRTPRTSRVRVKRHPEPAQTPSPRSQPMRNPFSSRTRSLPRAAASQPRPTHETGMPCKPRTALRWRGRAAHLLAPRKRGWPPTPVTNLGGLCLELLSGKGLESAFLEEIGLKHETVFCHHGAVLPEAPMDTRTVPWLHSVRLPPRGHLPNRHNGEPSVLSRSLARCVSFSPLKSGNKSNRPQASTVAGKGFAGHCNPSS